MQTYIANPKLLFQFYKSQKLPPLVKKHSLHNISLPMGAPKSPTGSSPQPSHNYQSYQTAINSINADLQHEIEQNRELRLIIKDMESQLTGLMEVNEGLCVRLQELENKYLIEVDASQLRTRQAVGRGKQEVFTDVQQYIRYVVEKFTEELINIKMSPIIENKLQNFMEQLLNINSQSIKQVLTSQRISRSRNQQFDQKQAQKTIRQIMHSHSKEKRKNTLSNTGNYEAILSKLKAENSQHRPGMIVTRSGVSGISALSAISGVSGISASKNRSNRRTKIFQNTSEDKKCNRSPSRSLGKKLDF